MDAALVLGTRPQIIKSAPFIHLASNDEQIQLKIIHTGQHYDYEMTKIFFEELRLTDPIANIYVGSGTHAQQTAKIMLRLEKILQKQKSARARTARVDKRKKKCSVIQWGKNSS